MARTSGKPSPHYITPYTNPSAEIQRSLRFDRASSAHLTYTPASASGDRTKITISAWVKKCGEEQEQNIFHAGTTSNDRATLRLSLIHI